MFVDCGIAMVITTDIVTQIYHSALGLLARREHSSRELQRKLLQRFPDSQSAINTTLTRLADEGYQSDDRYVEAYVRARVNKGYGLQRVRQELRQRGIADQLIDVAFAEMKSDGEMMNRLLEVWRKKFKGPPHDAKDKFRQITFLRYRGFSSSEIEQLFTYLCESET